MSKIGPFIIISVTGAHSSIGKTTLCSILLKNLKGFGAVKFTKTPLYTSVIEDYDTIMQKDTPMFTGQIRMAYAAAKK